MSMSLQARVGLFALLFPAFLLASGLVLKFANQQSLERVHTDRLSAYIYNLLAVAEPLDGMLWLPEELSDNRFNQIQSGLLALVRDMQGNLLWSSKSALGADPQSIQQTAAAQPGELVAGWTPDDGYLQAMMIVRFHQEPGSPLYQFQVFQAGQLIQQESRAFTKALVVGLLIAGGLLLVFMGVLMYWLLKPLYSVTRELRQVERGECELISQAYPREISALTRVLNNVIEAERKQRERYRHSLGDLAHSLKTPLAIIQGEIRQACAIDPQLVSAVQQQLVRVDDVVTYQLKRASSAGESLWSKPVAIGNCLIRVLDAMAKLYHKRGIVCDTNIEANAGFVGEESDFMEIAGNLIENAFKYSDTWVSVSARVEQKYLVMDVVDDGAGIPADKWEVAQRRGIRLDSRPIGQGIGLAVVAELVASYGGKLTLLGQESAAKGAFIRVRLPGKTIPTPDLIKTANDS